MDAPRPTRGYESGMFKPGDKASDGSVFLGETEDGSPLWSEPVDAPRPISDLAADVLDALESFPGAPCSCPKHKYLLDARDSVDALVARVTDLEAQLLIRHSVAHSFDFAAGIAVGVLIVLLGWIW